MLSGWLRLQPSRYTATAFSPIRQDSRYALLISSGVASLGMLTVLEMAPERNGCTAAIILMWPMYWMDRLPSLGGNAQSKIARCSSFRCGAPSIISLASMYLMMSSTCPPEYPSFFSTPGTDWLTIFITPPPTSFLYLTSAMSGSMPVVSQSIMKPMVPVGRQHRHLAVPVAVLHAEGVGLVPHRQHRAHQLLRDQGRRRCRGRPGGACR